MFPSIESYNPDLDQATADTIKQQMVLKSLAQLDLLRERLFFEAMEPTATTKEVLQLCEHLVKSTDLENVSKRPAEQASPLVNFGFVFHSPNGDTQVVGNVRASSMEPALPVIQGEPFDAAQDRSVRVEVSDPETEWGSLVA